MTGPALTLSPAAAAELAVPDRTGAGADVKGAEPARSCWRASVARRAGAERFEPWRDWALLTAFIHAVLLVTALLAPEGPALLLAVPPLGAGFAVATLTVMHDAGHRRLARRTWPNVLAVQTAVPVGLWVGHWTLKHRVHHKLSQVYPFDESTRSTAVLRLHPAAPLRSVHRWQHVYAWPLYGLAWIGELHSQLSYLRTGTVAGTDTPAGRDWRASFALEKALSAVVLTPYALLLGPLRLLVLMLCAMTVGSVVAGVVLVVGHINVGLWPGTQLPAGRDWAAYLMRTTASFSTGNPVTRWLTGGMTHHLAHHLRPVAPRAQLPVVHDRVAAGAVGTGEAMVVFPSMTAAVCGHWRRLRELGRPEPHRSHPLTTGHRWAARCRPRTGCCPDRSPSSPLLHLCSAL
ncbi:MAG: fatty acid desaturase family protein [Mycobacteriales bacterium]